MTFYALSALINAIISTFLGIFVFSRDRRDPRYLTHSFFSATIAIWSYFYFIWQITPYENIALFACRGLMAGAIFIPVCYLHHLAALFDIYDQKKKFIIYGYIGGLVFLALDFTPLFVKSVSPKMVFKFWPDAGAAFLPFLVLWIGYVLYGVAILIRQYRKSYGAYKNQIKYVILATFVGWSGGATNYPLWFNIPLLPLGNILVSGYMIILTYAILRYRLMDINLFITRAGIFILVYIFVLGIPFWLGFRYDLWKYSTSIMLFLASLGPFIYSYLRRRAEDILLREQRRYQQTLRQLSETMTLVKNLERLLKLIVYRVSKAVKVQFACIYLTDEAKGEFIQKSPYTNMESFPGFLKEIPFDSGIVTFLKQKHQPIFAEEIPPAIKRDFNLRGGLIVPSFVRNRLLGFLVLGPKSQGTIYTKEDAAIFEVLANQAALAIENTEFIDESQRTQAQLFAAERMTSMGAMAGGLSHQINNRLHAIAMATSDTIDTLKLLNFEQASKEEIKETFNQIQHALERIKENTKHGGKIVNDFLNFSQPDRLQKETKEFDITDPLERAIEMVKLKTPISDQDIQKEIAVDLPHIQGDFVLLQDVFFNLIDNAFDAIKEKEKLIGNATLKLSGTFKGMIKVSIVKTDSSITIQIHDNGIGIKEENQKKVFSPFFTTKATTSKGTGLGLFVIQKIIAVHQGMIKMSSQYGQGTMFIIALPVKQEKEVDHEP